MIRPTMIARSTTHNRRASGTVLAEIVARMYPDRVIGDIIAQGVSPTAGQVQEFEVLADDHHLIDTIEVTWPESAILSAVETYRDLAERAEAARVALHQAVRIGADAGLSEHYLASLTGLARDTVRKACGKS
jgi:hypothetical protein